MGGLVAPVGLRDDHHLTLVIFLPIPFRGSHVLSFALLLLFFRFCLDGIPALFLLSTVCIFTFVFFL